LLALANIQTNYYRTNFFLYKTMKNTPRGCLTAGGSQPLRVNSIDGHFC